MQYRCKTENVSTDNTWYWADGSKMTLPSDQWHAWYDGHPAEGACAVVTNYKYWDVTKYRMDDYVWRSFNCEFNVGKAIQGYICESEYIYINR